MTWLEALSTVAENWRDPEHPARAEAASEVLSGDRRFTEESVAFSLNHFAESVATGAIAEWVGDGSAEGGTVAVISLGRTPTEGLFETVAAALAGHRVALAVAGATAPLARAFFDELDEKADGSPVRLVRESEALDVSDAVVAIATDAELQQITETAAAASIPDDLIFAPVANGGVAVIDGTESRADLSGLAEDALLHEGGTPQSVRIVFAPTELDPDGFLETLAGFREMFPPHPATDGSLVMRAAFLEAAKSPLAVGPGFLLSKGAPEWLEQSHIRWCTYDAIEEVVQWTDEHKDEIGFVSASRKVASALSEAGLPDEIEVLGPGDAHRPVAGQPPLSEDLWDFLRSL